MLAEFLVWWGGQITDLARYGLRPAGSTGAGMRQPDALLLVATQSGTEPGLPGLELDIEERLELAFSVGFNSGVMAQAMKDAKEKQK